MVVLTPAERRVALLLVALLVLGAGSDLIQAHRAIRPKVAPRLDESAWASPAPASPAPPPAAPVSVSGLPAPIDVNRADARQLDALPGVGPVLAARIIEHRRRFGAFRAAADLRAVRGIGPKLFARLEPLVSVGPVTPGDSGAGAAADSRSAIARGAPGVRSAPGRAP